MDSLRHQRSLMKACAFSLARPSCHTAKRPIGPAPLTMTSVEAPFTAIAFPPLRLVAPGKFSRNSFRLVGHEIKKKQNRSCERWLEELFCVNGIDANASFPTPGVTQNLFTPSDRLGIIEWALSRALPVRP